MYTKIRCTDAFWGKCFLKIIDLHIHVDQEFFHRLRPLPNPHCQLKIPQRRPVTVYDKEIKLVPVFTMHILENEATQCHSECDLQNTTSYIDIVKGFSMSYQRTIIVDR